jgi:hypothetical protein
MPPVLLVYPDMTCLHRDDFGFVPSPASEAARGLRPREEEGRAPEAKTNVGPVSGGARAILTAMRRASSRVRRCGAIARRTAKKVLS